MKVITFKIWLAVAFAIAIVPLSKGGVSKTPAGPFQKIVFALFIVLVNLSMLTGPISSAIMSSGILFWSTIVI